MVDGPLFLRGWHPTLGDPHGFRRPIGRGAADDQFMKVKPQQFSIRILGLATLFVAIVLGGIRYPNEITSPLASWFTVIVTAGAISAAFLSRGKTPFLTTFGVFALALLIVRPSDNVSNWIAEQLWTMVHDPEGVESSDKGEFYNLQSIIVDGMILSLALIAGSVSCAYDAFHDSAKRR